jgi:NADPH:quinone reductase-like Zn-dependent oxidoreductase
MLKEQYKCEHVLNSSDADFLEKFRNLSKELKATALIECVSGDTTGQLMECLPNRSTVVFYGALSEKGASSIDPLLMIGRNYRLEGFVLGQFLNSKGIWIIGVIKEMNALMADKTLQSNV